MDKLKLTLLNKLKGDVMSIFKDLKELEKLFMQELDISTGIVPRITINNVIDELPKNSNVAAYKKRSIANLTNHVIHHTAVNKDSSVQAIARYHVNNKNWPAIGYTFYINYDGTIYQCNELDTMSYATAYHNHTMLSTCLAGSFMRDRYPTEQQQLSLRWLHHIHLPIELGRKLPLLAHKEVPDNHTSCCGSTWEEWKPNILKGFYE